VEILEPEPGTTLDRERHAVERTVPADAPSGTIVEVHDPGFTVEGDVITKASVYVAE
jgi:molecular chaperone GrpE